MDIATILGFVLAIGLTAWAMIKGGGLGTFIDVPSAVMVFGGSLGVTIMSLPFTTTKKFVSVLRKALVVKRVDPVEHVAALVKLAEIARRDGILSLENHLNDGSYDDFMVRGLRMAIDGQDPAIIQAAMEKEVECMLGRHGEGKIILDTLGKYAPAFGMLGTIIGLVIMLKNMDDPAAIGPGMALALITTFYGSVLLNVVWGPLADKLALRSGEEMSVKALVIQGVMSIQSGDNPRIVQQKLLAFLNPRQRARVEAKE